LLSAPHGLALTIGGDLLIADGGNNAIRLVTISSDQINTVAGTGLPGYSGDGGQATLAELNDPYGVAVRSDGTIAIADLENQRVRQVSAGGVISTVAGTGQMGFSGDGGPPADAQLAGPAAVAFDPAGDLFIADSGNNRVRMILGNDPGSIETVVGNGSEQFTGDGGDANLATVYGPYAVLVDQAGNIWLSDTFHNRVREISSASRNLTYLAMKVGNISAPVPGSIYNEGNAALILSEPVLNEAALDTATTTCNQTAMLSSATCNMGVEFAPTQVGASISGSIHWPSNAPNLTPVDHLKGPVLSVDVTSVAITSSQNPGILGHPITLTATVASDDTGRTGKVNFAEGADPWCSAVTLGANGTATCTIASLSLGSHTFIASYSGDTNNAPSTSAPYVEVIKQQPALALTAAPNPAVVTGNVSLTLTAVDQSGTPTGVVVFYDGATILQTVNLNGAGTAQWTTQVLSVGAHTLTAQYEGDSANLSGTSNTVHEQITKATTATALASSANPSNVGSSITFTANVTNSGGPTITGTVNFTDGATTLGSEPLSGSGTCSIVVSTLAQGSHSIVASYVGGTDNAASSSAPLTETIQPIGTVTTLAANANPIDAGAPLLLTATVSLAQQGTADGALTGTVTFRDGSAVLGIEPIDGSGQATLDISTLSVGTHSLIASFDGSTNYSTSNSATVTETVDKTSTQTALNSASSSTLMGKPAAFTAVVTSATGTPAGQVSFFDGTTVLATVAVNSSGIAAFSTTALLPGTHSITAEYLGNNSFVSSTSAILQQVVQLAQPTLLLTGPSSAVDAGTSAQFVANLTTAGVSPTGTMTLLNGSSIVQTLNVTGNGNLAFSTSTLSIGTHTLIANYSGDANNSSAVSTAVIVVIQQANSNTALVPSADPLTLGAPLTLTATVTSDSPSAGGQVSFYDGATFLGRVALGPNDKAAFSPASFSLGTHTLTAVYSGDTNHAGSTSSLLTELVVQTTNATLTSNNNPAESGQSITFTAQISGAGSTRPTGTAIFRDGGTLLATVTLNSIGAASFTANTLSVGSHSIQMSYSGDDNFAAVLAQLIETVTDATTQLTITASANPATYASPLNLSATVTSKGGPATGPVTFTDAGSNIGSAQLNAGGVASLTLSMLAPGTHTLVANYAGDGKANASVSTPLTLVVKQTTTLAVSSSSNPMLTLSEVTLTASIKNAGAAEATGTVSFTDGGLGIGTAELDTSGHATLTLSKMSAGSHEIVASYPGDGSNFASFSGGFSETVQLRPTVTTVTGSSTDAHNPQQVTLIAVVDGQGAVLPGGKVTFTSGGVTLGEATVGDTGVATITVIFSQSTELLVASYSGDDNYAASQSSKTSISGGEAAQFMLTVNPSTITLVAHQHTTLGISIGSVKGYSDTIELGCLGLPYAATCIFTPSEVKLSSDGTATASLILDTGDPLGAGSGTSALLVHGRGTFLACLPLGLLVGLLRSKKARATQRKLGMLLAFVVAIALSLGVSGCGGLNISGTQPGTYSFRVVGIGTISGITETQTMTLIVKQ
jgi:hypothetical protein